jgi:hypothetical protein
MSDTPRRATKDMPVRHEPAKPPGYQERQGQPRLTPRPSQGTTQTPQQGGTQNSK